MKVSDRPTDDEPGRMEVILPPWLDSARNGSRSDSGGEAPGGFGVTRVRSLTPREALGTRVRWASTEGAGGPSRPGVSPALGT